MPQGYQLEYSISLRLLKRVFEYVLLEHGGLPQVLSLTVLSLNVVGGEGGGWTMTKNGHTHFSLDFSGLGLCLDFGLGLINDLFVLDLHKDKICFQIRSLQVKNNQDLFAPDSGD